MVQENISQEFRLKNRDETRNYFIEKVNQNKLISNEQRKICTRNNRNNCISHLWENLKNEKYTHLLNIIFGVPI